MQTLASLIKSNTKEKTQKCNLSLKGNSSKVLEMVNKTRVKPQLTNNAAYNKFGVLLRMPNELGFMIIRNEDRKL